MLTHVCIFYLERERASTRGAERGGGRTPSRLRTVSAEPDAGLDPTNREIMTGAKTKSQTLNRMSPQAPLYGVFINISSKRHAVECVRYTKDPTKDSNAREMNHKDQGRRHNAVIAPAFQRRRGDHRTSRRQLFEFLSGGDTPTAAHASLAKAGHTLVAPTGGGCL